jgi:hypothetical protein
MHLSKMEFSSVRSRPSLLVSALAILATFLLTSLAAEPSKVGSSQSGGTGGVRPDFSGVWMQRQTANTLTASEPSMRPEATALLRAARPGYGPHATPDSQDPILSCAPPGVPRIMLLPFPWKIVQTRNEVIMIFEYDHFIRQIPTDRPTHSRVFDMTWMGDSIGHWEGDTLVIDTVGLNDKTWLDQVGHPHSSSLHVVERLRRTDRSTLEDEITIDDPKYYAKPWTGKLTYLLRPGWNLSEYVCEDNINFLEYHKKEVGSPSR